MPLTKWKMAPPRGGRYYEDLVIGDTATRQMVVTREAIDLFGEISGDYNPVHFDAEYAAQTVFREPIAHGMLSAAYISAVIGMELPGPGAIYVSQSLAFKAPVKVGDVVLTAVRVAELLPKRRARLETACSVGGRVVLEGEAVLLVPARPE
jgi:3-hydroxybutyryl-CoA dehydratase